MSKLLIKIITIFSENGCDNVANVTKNGFMKFKSNPVLLTKSFKTPKFLKKSLKYKNKMISKDI